jgi:hypothetical protein
MPSASRKRQAAEQLAGGGDCVRLDGHGAAVTPFVALPRLILPMITII